MFEPIRWLHPTSNIQHLDVWGRARHFGSFVRLATTGESRHGLRYPGFLTILHVGLQQTAHLVEKGNVGKVFAVTRSAIRF
mgnify:CR=1 FL=1